MVRQMTATDDSARPARTVVGEDERPFSSTLPATTGRPKGVMISHSCINRYAPVRTLEPSYDARRRQFHQCAANFHLLHVGIPSVPVQRRVITIVRQFDPAACARGHRAGAPTLLTLRRPCCRYCSTIPTPPRLISLRYVSPCMPGPRFRSASSSVQCRDAMPVHAVLRVDRIGWRGIDIAAAGA